ncbi:hypothetical protein [Sphingobium chungbukense]|uniref:hypothetical protein n=1 Tax=Sphingobium chungbukense TaxID=56193 RepID=UPI0006996599|nr:hypothetical protein [Sphingobium chungbukense]
MAVTVTTTISGPYIPNGATTVFAFDFKAGSADEIEVYRDTGADWELVPGADFTATVDPEQEGGDVEFSVAPAIGSGNLYIVSEPFFTREGQYTGEGPFTPKGLNNQFDKAAVRDLALARDVGRSIRAPLGEAGFEMPRAALRANKYLAFDAAGGAYLAEGGPAPLPMWQTVGVAAESLDDNDFVNLFDSGADIGVRKASAADRSKMAHGFVLSAKAPGQPVSVIRFGVNPVSVADTYGEVWLSATNPGKHVGVAPSGDNEFIQPLGTAVPGEGIFFTYQGRVG